MATFKSYIVELAGKSIQDPNIKVNVGAQDKKSAIKAALRKHPKMTEADVVKTFCKSHKVYSGQTLSSYSAR